MAEESMDRVFIKDLIVKGIIGVGERERLIPQDIQINIILYTDILTGGKTDKIEDCVNYRTIAKKIIAQVSKSNRYTVEALATDIAELCLEDKIVQKVQVRVEKPGAVRFSRSVGVEIERSQQKK
jgi:FolB domain-containing protein